MSIELVKKYYEEFNKKNIEGILDLCSDNVINEPNQGENQIGKELLRNFFKISWSHFKEDVYDLDILCNQDGSNVATEYTVRGTYFNTKENLFPATNQKYDITCTTLFKFKDNKISKITRYYNTKKWLDMVKPD